MKSSRQDLLLSDVAMPDQGGYDLLCQMQLKEAEQNILAISLTAYTSHASREESLRVGFKEQLIKPLEPEVLVRMILTLL